MLMVQRQEAGLTSLLSTLAEDATRAAAESPFLEDRLPYATAVLCVMIVPRHAVDTAGAAGATILPPGAAGTDTCLVGTGPLLDNSSEHALRAAVQVRWGSSSQSPNTPIQLEVHCSVTASKGSRGTAA
jgi:hypothetical protein